MDSVASSGKDFLYGIWQVNSSHHTSVPLQEPSWLTLFINELLNPLVTRVYMRPLSLPGQPVHAQTWCSCSRGELKTNCILLRVVFYEFDPTLT